jgi:prefoldin subunit 2
LTNVEPLKGDRKCWKVIGGVLVEQTLDETIESLKQTVNMLEQTLKALDEEMGKRQKQVVELEMKYNLNPNNKQAELVQ